MKKLLALIALVALLVFAWFVWFKPAVHEEAEAAPETEVPVHVGKIGRTTLRGYVIAYGTVEPEPAGERPAASARIAPAVSGVVVQVNCAEGQQVAKGAVLFQLDPRVADVAATYAEKNLDRQEKLIQVEGTSQKAVQEAEQQLAAARTQQALLQVESPLAGTISHIYVKPGEAADLTTVLAEVLDLNRLIVSANVPAGELGPLMVGQTAEVITDPSADKVAGSVTYISPEVDMQRGTAGVRVGLSPGSGLRPGQFVTVRIVSAEHRDCLAVPVESVVKDEAGATVVAVVQNDTAVQKPVKTGLRDGELVEVAADGLQPGMTVVTQGAYPLPKETKVRVLGN